MYTLEIYQYQCKMYTNVLNVYKMSEMYTFSLVNEYFCEMYTKFRNSSCPKNRLKIQYVLECFLFF